MVFDDATVTLLELELASLRLPQKVHSELELGIQFAIQSQAQVLQAPVHDLVNIEVFAEGEVLFEDGLTRFFIEVSFNGLQQFLVIYIGRMACGYRFNLEMLLLLVKYLV